MSNGRIAAIGYFIGFWAFVWLNALVESDILINLARMYIGGFLFAAVAVAVFGDRRP